MQGSTHVKQKDFILEVNVVNWQQIFSVSNRFFLVKMSSMVPIMVNTVRMAYVTLKIIPAIIYDSCTRTAYHQYLLLEVVYVAPQNPDAYGSDIG